MTAGCIRPRSCPPGRTRPTRGFRIERDPLGELQVPAAAYYGVQTARAVENFPISGLTAPPELVTATILIKKAAAQANAALGRLPTRRSADAIVAAADEILAGSSARSVRRRRLPGRRRHLAQHERQRGAGQPRRRDPRRRARRVHARASQRSRQHGAVDQRRLSRRRRGWRCCSMLPDLLAQRPRARRRAAPARAGEFAARAQDRPHPPAGRGADHARAGVRRLRRLRRGAAPTKSSAACGQAARAEPRRHGGRHRPQRRRRLHARGDRPPRDADRRCRCGRRRTCSASRRAWATCWPTRARCAGWRSKSARSRQRPAAAQHGAARRASRRSCCRPCSPARRSCRARSTRRCPRWSTRSASR